MDDLMKQHTASMEVSLTFGGCKNCIVVNDWSGLAGYVCILHSELSGSARAG